jgi:DNA-binding transcriptional MocR family regulator
MDTSLNGAIFQAAFEKEVLYVPGGLCFARRPGAGDQNAHHRATLRLSYGGASEDAIRLGAQRLGDALKEFVPG